MKDIQLNAGVIRDNYWDQVKGVLILLVVFGHVLEQCLSGRINTTTYSWIYTFHMPLFVFVSGYFTRIKDVKHYWKGILNLFGQFAVFQLLLTAPLLVGGGIYEIIIPKYTMVFMVYNTMANAVFYHLQIQNKLEGSAIRFIYM